MVNEKIVGAEHQIVFIAVFQLHVGKIRQTAMRQNK